MRWWKPQWSTSRMFHLSSLSMDVALPPIIDQVHSLWMRIPPALQTSEHWACTPCLPTSTLFSRRMPLCSHHWKELAFTFSPRDGSSADPEAASTFLQAIASTLTTLNISFNNTSDEPSLVLRRFSRQKSFPKLATFSLFHSEPLALPSPTLVQFLNQHADTLECLSLQHARSSPFASQWPDDLDPSFFPVLPHLETLNIRSGSSYRNIPELASSEGLDAARGYIQHSTGALTTLGLTHCSFTLHDLGMLLDFLGRGFSGNAEGAGLKNLDVSIQILSPQMLDMLAEKLPRLAKLKVDFEDLRSNDGGDIPPWTGEGGRAGLEDLTHEVQLFFVVLFLSILTFSFSWMT